MNGYNGAGALCLSREELTRRLEDFATAAGEILEALHKAASSPRAENWRPHLPQMHSAVVTFVEFCQDQIDSVCGARLSDVDADCIHDGVFAEANRLFDWLGRMTGSAERVELAAFCAAGPVSVR